MLLFYFEFRRVVGCPFVGSSKSSVLMETTLTKAEVHDNLLISETGFENRRLPLGRILNAFFNAKLAEVEAKLYLLSQNPKKSFKDDLLEALSCFEFLVTEAARGNTCMDELLKPLLEYAVKSKGKSNRRKVGCLLLWLCQKDTIFSAIADSIENLVMTYIDHHILLGWCVVIRELIEKWHKSADSGKQYHYMGYFLQMVCHCIPQLLCIVNRERAEHDGFVLPTRLSIAAADCILTCTQALAGEYPSKKKINNDPEKRTQQIHSPGVSSQISIEHFESGSLTLNEGSHDGSNRNLLLWNQLDHLISLLQQLMMWSRKSRLLHSKGLEQTYKHLEWMKAYRDSLIVNQDIKNHELETAMAYFSACWKYYSRLMVLEDYNFYNLFKEYLVDFVLSLQQCHSQSVYENANLENRQNRFQTTLFFLTCIALLLGRLDSCDLKNALGEVGSELLNILFAQLRHADNGITDIAVDILREVIFRTTICKSGDAESAFLEMDMMIPSLIGLLDECDSASRAVVLFVAEYFAMNPEAQGIQKLFECLDSKNKFARRNAIDVISELLPICLHSGHAMTESLSQNIAKHLLERLGDEELTNRAQVSRLFAQLDPSFVLPGLIHSIFARDVRIQSAASNAIVEILKSHRDICSVLSVFLDCVRISLKNVSIPEHPGQLNALLSSSSTVTHKSMDVDMIMRLIPKWSQTVQNWEPIVEMLLRKMFAETSNSVIPRFLSTISNHLADVSNIVFKFVLSNMQNLKEVEENMLTMSKEKDFIEQRNHGAESLIFERLSPLLVLRILPLQAFNNLHSRELYGTDADIIKDGNSIAKILTERMLLPSEFEDVRKLAAEIVGKLHPKVTMPILASQVGHAACNKDLKRLKACLFAICNSLMLWEKEAYLHPEMPTVRYIITVILSWESLESDEVMKAQHGCIDCLAFMICAELQIIKSKAYNGRPGKKHKSQLVEELTDDNDNLSMQSNPAVLDAAVQVLIGRHQLCSFFLSNKLFTSQDLEHVSSIYKGAQSEIIGYITVAKALSFRLCMGNVLISVCLKISENQKSLCANVSVRSFTDIVIPALIHHVHVSKDLQIRLACLQVLFTVVYHMKSSIHPYAMDLLDLSIRALRSGNLLEEHMAGAKLMASLMSGNDDVLESIAPKLIEAKIALSASSFISKSAELRSLCERLLECMSSPVDTS